MIQGSCPVTRVPEDNKFVMYNDEWIDPGDKCIGYCPSITPKIKWDGMACITPELIDPTICINDDSTKPKFDKKCYTQNFLTATYVDGEPNRNAVEIGPA